MTLPSRIASRRPDENTDIAAAVEDGVRVFEKLGHTVERFAGTGKRGYTGDGGKALEATFDGPKEIDIDKDGNVFVVDTENEAIRRIETLEDEVRSLRKACADALTETRMLEVQVADRLTTATELLHVAARELA